ncbi:MAG TPA: hypothetical protein VER17_06745 [Tepidisphaeraceae bacterium]|nr:hypothetical protein [Tepidisphaeraceae bacterium]
MADARTDPLHYLREIRANVEKLQAQGQVTPTENALFGMLDGMAGLMTFTLDQMADMRRRIDAMESR